MISIGMGDGCIPHHKRNFRVTLNKSQEPQYALYVYDLMFNTLHKKASIYEPPDADAIKFTIYMKDVVKSLIYHGLKPGDKRKDQVDVPNLIKKNNKFRIKSIRGLVDTDGSIHIHKHAKRVRINFKNASFPLVESFKENCESNDIKTEKIRPTKGQNTFYSVIETKKDVVKFLDKIQPKKWEYRAETLGLVLISISEPVKRVKIERELARTYKDKKVHYSNTYKEKLKYLCVKYGYDVSNESIYNHLEKSLSYDEKYTRLTHEEKLKLNKYAKRLINDLRKRLE